MFQRADDIFYLQPFFGVARPAIGQERKIFRVRLVFRGSSVILDLISQSIVFFLHEYLILAGSMGFRYVPGGRIPQLPILQMRKCPLPYS